MPYETFANPYAMHVGHKHFPPRHIMRAPVVAWYAGHRGGKPPGDRDDEDDTASDTRGGVYIGRDATERLRQWVSGTRSFGKARSWSKVGQKTW